MCGTTVEAFVGRIEFSARTAMECTPIEEKEATVRVLEWAGAECLYQVRVRRLEAWTAALIQEAAASSLRSGCLTQAPSF